MTILGIESSCDETSVGIVRNGTTILANTVATSLDLHTAYGGVVPEIAARSHIEFMMPVIEEALTQAFGDNPDPWAQIDAIAVAHGPGLKGSLLIGVMTARTLAITKQKPLYAVHHVEAHAYANFLTGTATPDNTLDGKTYTFPAQTPQFPTLALLVSGKHSQIVLFRDHFNYTLLGQTGDDAVGEAFDKVAKLLGLPYPGGPSVAKAADQGDPKKYKLPKARLANKYDYSFSGVKTAVLRLAQELVGEDFTFPSYKLAERLSEAQKNDIAASFRHTAIETLVDKVVATYEEYQPKSVIIGGGVAADRELRKQLAERLPITINYPDLKLCTDNGAMVATLGFYNAQAGQEPANPYSLEADPSLKM